MKAVRRTSDVKHQEVSCFPKFETERFVVPFSLDVINFFEDFSLKCSQNIPFFMIGYLNFHHLTRGVERRDLVCVQGL